MKTKKIEFCIYILFLIVCIGCERAAENDQQSPGGSSATIVETGELAAVSTKVLGVPSFNYEYGRAKLIWLETEGVDVTTGDVIARFDTSSVKRVWEQKIADRQIAIAEIDKIKAEHASQMEEIVADLRSAEAAIRQAAIDTQRVNYESPARQEISRLHYKVQEIDYLTAMAKIENTRKVQEEEILIQKEKIKQKNSAIKAAEIVTKRFAVKAPSEGIVEYQKSREGRKIQVGEEFWPGRPLLGLPNLSKMKAKTSVVETDVMKIKIGQTVLVRLDAYPKATFSGEIISIGITCHDKDEDSKIKVFDVEVLLDESDPILKPGMTVSCEFVLEGT